MNVIEYFYLKKSSDYTVSYLQSVKLHTSNLTNEFRGINNVTSKYVVSKIKYSLQCLNRNAYRKFSYKFKPFCFEVF